VRVTPSSNSVNIVRAKQATFVVGGEMARFFARRLEAAGGDPGQVRSLRYGGLYKVGGVSIASVPAVHSNGLDPAFLNGPQGEALAANGLTAYVGPPGGYVVAFSNGLVVYLSGDTGITAEQNLVVRGFYKANLAVINIGGTFTTGPAEAAYVINELVKPRAVIPSHANEEAIKEGKLLPGTRTETFVNAVQVPVHVPLSGRTMEFDGGGQCQSGC
jgi:L-ascorbate metabolism protein UlaG (beta-lactamase superfamily)